MKQKDALYSRYLIDGLEADYTPAELLRDYGEINMPEEDVDAQIADESIDPTPTPSTFRQSEIASYISTIEELPEVFPIYYARPEAKARTAFALIDTLWLDGHFGLKNLQIKPSWKWSDAKLGNMAAFYDSVESLGEYVSELGIKMSGFGYEESEEKCSFSVEASVSEKHALDQDDEETIIPGTVRTCPGKVKPDPDSWIVYLPFDTCPYRLGGSALSAIAGNGGDNAPDVQDADYFIDCYEVIREMVEDGIAISGVTVGKGGLIAAAAKLCAETGITLDISGIASSCSEDNAARILFGEVPGALIQFSDNDFDYIDSQFLLQDVAYYPVGHPCGEAGVIKVRHSRKPAVAGILGALLTQATEGED